MKLKNKVGIVTGGGGGLGLAMAEGLKKEGCKVAIFDIKKPKKKIGRFYKTDVTSEEEIIESIKKVKKDFGKIDILINNAGIFTPTPATKTKKEDWDKIINVNLRGYFLMAKNAIPKMKNGKIINIASVAGHHAFANSSAYNSTKGAVIQLTKTLALDYPKLNVNAICPGIFKTPMTKDLLKSKEMKSMIKNSVIKGRPGKAEEITGLAVYLASDDSSYMTGSVITIDGGWTCHL
jgi:dihydroanticapsin dehydrogenase